MIPVSVTIITRNEEQQILRTLESVKPVAAEIIVVDSLSTDRTVEICEKFGCRVFHRAFSGYGSQKQFAVDQATHDWILSIDADETLTPELAAEIIRIFSSGTIPVAGYQIPRRLHYLGRVMKYSGVGKEKIMRLFNRKMGQFTQVPVHESIEITGSSAALKGYMLHYSYRDLTHHVEKLNHYTTLAATGYRQKGRHFPKIWVALKGPVTFLTFYFWKGGILDGYPGFVWSWLAAVYTSLKVAKTIEMENQR
jgi:glycosyltransferase involved in cell wall biosynthesis